MTEAGKRLMRACDRLGIMVDLSHITEKGFWDVAAISGKPLVATHSNVHALSPSSRNLTDRQLEPYAPAAASWASTSPSSSCATTAARTRRPPCPPWSATSTTSSKGSASTASRSGSDFDGALIPAEIADASGLQKLVAALEKAGYGSAELDKICRGNWLRVLGATFA